MNFTDTEIEFMIVTARIDVPSPSYYTLVTIFKITPERAIELLQFQTKAIHKANVGMRALMGLGEKIEQ